MENNFDKVSQFVKSLERTSLSEEQQAMLLAGGIFDETTTGRGGNNSGDCSNSS